VSAIAVVASDTDEAVRTAPRLHREGSASRSVSKTTESSSFPRPVDHGVVGLRDERPVIVLEALDEPDLQSGLVRSSCWT